MSMFWSIKIVNPNLTDTAEKETIKMTCYYKFDFKSKNQNGIEVRNPSSNDSFNFNR